MNRPHGQQRIRGVSIGCSIALVFALAPPAEIQAQEIRRLPAVEELRHARSEIRELRQEVRELETTVAAIQKETATSPGDPVDEAVYSQQHTPSSPPVKRTSFAESIFGADYSLDVGGYVKVDVIHDFDAIGSTDAFDPLSIPTDGRQGENTRIHARQTRLNLDLRSHPDEDDLRLFIEGDFFGAGSTFRMRHALVRCGRLLAGQTWSTFMDESILPGTLDFESPRSVILDRRGLLCWTQPATESLALAVALEDPQPAFDIDSAPPGDIERAAPDLIARVRYQRPWGHLQAAGLVRSLRFRQLSGERDDAAGWGFNFTGRVYPHDFHSILFQLAVGDGLQSYRQGNDAAVDANGNLEVVPVIAWVIGYEIDWTDRLSSAFVYSAAQVTNASFQLDDAGHAVDYLAANIIFKPRPRLSWGVEYLHGTRTDKGGAEGDAHRVQFSVRYDLP